MPLSKDEKINKLADDLLKAIDALFGLHPGFRPVHAKGIMLTGTFTPSPEAASYTRALHLVRGSTPVTVRFSNGTGIPVISDNDPHASPHGFAIRFHLADHVHTDIVSHSTDGFPTRDGQEFLELLKAVASGDPTSFFAAHPTALAFEKIPKPNPASFATETYFGVTAFRFINRDGVARYGRYRIVPEAGVHHLDEATAQSKGANYLLDELTQRLAKGPIRFNIQVQLAQEGDKVNDATIHWPADRPTISFGTLVLTAKAPEDETHQRIIFDPIPRVDGVEPSEDPLLELRAAIYLISGRRRRQAADSPARTPQPV